MSMSKKMKAFTSEPMGEKAVKSLPGIGKKLGDKLIGEGFQYAYNVLGQFLKLGKNEDLMVKWLNYKIGANRKQAGDCAKCLNIWCDAFL